MYYTPEAIQFAVPSTWRRVRNVNRAISRSGQTLYAAYLTAVLTDTPAYPSRNIADLVSRAWRLGLVGP
jgi:hypothetical protein